VYGQSNTLLNPRYIIHANNGKDTQGGSFMIIKGTDTTNPKKPK